MKIRKLLSAIIAGAMVLGTMSFPAFAEGEVASIGDTTYTTLAAAVAAAKANDTIMLVDNTTESGKVTITDKTINIDFDGHTLNGSILINGNSVVTIANGYIRQTELVSGIEVAENANVTINNMDVESFRHAIRVDADNANCVATAVINGGKYVSTNNTTTCHAINIGSANGKSVVTINDGEFYGPVNNVHGGNSLMVQNHNDDVKIYGGYFAKASGIEGCICPADGLKIYGTNSPKFGTWGYDRFIADGSIAVKINDIYTVCPTLTDAVVAAQNGDTVKLLANASGNGVVIPSGSNITIDLGGFTYNVDGTTVGSAGTATQAFQLLKNSNITIKNGTITSDKARMLIQNYSNLTLEDVTLDGTNLVGAVPYTLSNNCGNTVLKGNTNIIAKEGGVAFDCYYWPSNGYTEGVTVTLGTDFTGKITGKIEMDNDGTDTANAASKQDISISGGRFTTDVSAFLADGYKLTANEDGTYVVEEKYVAKIGDTKYFTLTDAISSLETATGDVTIEVLDDTQLQLKGFYIPLVNDNITSLTINGNGNIINVIADYRLRLWMNGKLIINNATLTSDWFEAYTWDSWDFLFDCETELKDVTLNREIALEKDAKLTNITINSSSNDDSYAVWIPTNGQNIAMDNVTINAAAAGKRGIKIDNQYVDDAAVGKVELKVENSTFNTNKKSAILVKSPVGATITASGNNITNVLADQVNLVWVDSDASSSCSEVNITIDGEPIAPYLEDTGIVVAQIGNAYYASLADAVAAAQNGDTVKLLANASGNGVVIPSGSNITIDLGGFTYNVDGTTVGSAGTATQAFQLLKNSNITIKNGTITSDKARMLIQNYSNLTLENVTLDGSKLVGNAPYTLSNNCGNTVLKGNTNIIAKEGGVAFDCYYWPSNGYTEGVTVTLGTDFTGTITGKIEMDNDRTDTANAASKQSISISGGTFTTDVSTFLADGYKLTEKADGTYGVVLGEEETEPEILKNSLYVTYSQLGKFDFGSGEVNSIKMSFFAGVDSLNYSEVGFDVTLNGVTQTFPVTVVYDSVKVNMNGEVQTINASEFGKGVNHIFGQTINFPATEEFKDASVEWVPYAIKNKVKITGNKFNLTDIFPGTLEVK